MTTTSSTDVAGILAARKSELAAGAPQTEYPDAGPATAAITADEVIPAADARTGEIVPAAAGNGTPPGGAALPPVPSPTPGEPPARPPDYSMIPAKVLGGIPYASEYARLAKTVCNTEMVPGGFRGRWDAVMAAYMKGHEMGLPPMQSLDSFNVIDGKVGLGAEAMRALTMGAGHQIILDEVTDEAGRVVAIRADCRRSDWPIEMWRSYTFSMEDALMAGLLKTPRSGNPGSWQKYPRAMMEARATSGACRRYFPDVLAGMSYTPEEIRDFDGPQEEVAPSPSANAGSSNVSPSPASSETAPSSGSGVTEPHTPPLSPSPPAASAPATPSVAPPAQAAPADSTGGASATSLADAATSAPPTNSPPAKKAKGATKKAPARSTAAPSAPPPAASTPPDASAPPSEALTPTEAGDGSPTTPAAAPGTSSGSNGEGSVLVQMRHALVEIIKGQPQAQQSLIRAFLQRHYPGGSDTMDTPEKIQKAIDIAVGWPDSAEQNPPPEQAGILKWEGFSTRVVDLGGELEARCDLCEWRLPQAETQKNLPDFRQLELSVAVCVSHEQDAYADGTPYCPGKPVQGQLG